MAFLYRQKKSAFWWVEFRNAAGQIVRKSTKLRADLASETKRAHQLCAEMKKREGERADSYPELWDTRCYRANIPEHAVMKLVGHASTTVHRVYPRLAVETDLQAQISKLSALADEPTAKNQAA